jgi:hypothetical protein
MLHADGMMYSIVGMADSRRTSGRVVSEWVKVTPIEARPIPQSVTPGADSFVIADEMHGFQITSLRADASPEEKEAFLNPGTSVPFAEHIASIRIQADAELRLRGLPPVDQYVLEREGTWVLAPDHVTADPMGDHPEYAEWPRITAGIVFIRSFCGPFSAEWFLADIAECVRRVETSEGETRLWSILGLGKLLELYHHRAFTPLVKKAAKNWRDAAAGGHARSAATRPRTSAILAAMDRLVEEGHSVSRAAELCAGRGVGTSAAANAKLYARHK